MTGPDPAGQTPVGAPGHRRRPRGTLLWKCPMAGSGGQPSGFFLSGINCPGISCRGRDQVTSIMAGPPAPAAVPAGTTQ